MLNLSNSYKPELTKIDNELTKKSMFDKENDEEVEKQRVVAGKTHDLKECKLCSKRFKKCNELESQIKNCHENYREFKCDQCEKTFVLEWRLKKHINLHTDDNVQRCHYFNNTKNCPFEELGCKFLHAPSDFCRLGLSCQRRLCPQRHLDMEKNSVKIDTEIRNTTEDLMMTLLRIYLLLLHLLPKSRRIDVISALTKHNV